MLRTGSRAFAGVAPISYILKDQLRAELRWDGRDLKELHGKHVRLRFQLKNADLYSFWLEL